MGTILKDVGYAARTLRRNPGFALTAIVTIALGIGASTAIFSVVNAVLLRPLPYANEDRLALIWGDLTRRNVPDFPFPPGDLPDLRQQGTLFEGFAGVNTFNATLLGDNAEPEQVQGGGITPNFFGLLGVPVLLGRDFTEADGTPVPPPPPGANPQPGPPLPAILSYGLWQRRYGGDRGVIGRSVETPFGPLQVVGVLGPGFELLFPPGTGVARLPDVWTPLRIDFATASRINVFLRIVGRMKPGVTPAQAQEQLDRISTDLRQRFPIKESAGLHLRLELMHDDLVADVRPAIQLLMGAVIFVLLIGCANVANLQLVRASGRERELSIRAALGGSRWRLVRELLAESAVIAAGGAVVGVALAQLGIQLLVAAGPENLPRLDKVAINGTVLAFAAAAALVAALLSGVMPAMKASRPDVMETLRASGRTAMVGAGRWLRNIAVIGEIALTFVLLAGCGLMFRSFLALQHTDPGFSAQGVLTFQLPFARRRQPEELAAFRRQVRDRLAALPGVQSVTAATPLPLDGTDFNGRWGTEAALADPNAYHQATIHIVEPGYFSTLRTPLIEGRTFTEADNVPAATVVVIDDLLARQAFPGQSAVGKRILSRFRGNEPEWLDVIGVVKHQRHLTLAAPGREAMFVTDGQLGFGNANRWAVRSSGNPVDLASAVRAAIHEIDPNQPVAEVQPMSAFLDHAEAPTKFALLLITIFAGIAVVLAAVGLYGVLSTVVRQRTAEIGVRMAFGAPRTSIFQLIVRQGLRACAGGLALGVIAALLLTRLMTTMLVGVAATDPPTYVVMGLLFLGVAAFASWLPARRAAGLDPAVTLREE